MRVLIAGAGIGGLTAAHALRAKGHDVVVLERAPAIREVGAGIQLPPNAVKVFDALGLTDRVTRRAVRPDALEARMGESGRRLFRVPLGEPSEARWGAPYFHIHRADYVAALAEGLDIQTGADVVRYETPVGAVGVRLATGETLSADLLIGADGLHSAVRRQMLGAESPRFTGNRAWRVTVPVERLGDDAPDRTACVWMGRGRHAVTYLLRGGELANFVGVVEADAPGDEGWEATGRRDDALADFAGWHPVITKLLERADASAFRRWALYDRDPLPRWTDGTVALLGDAAHPMLPFMAQGAAMAVEDAWVLAETLGDDIIGSLTRYEAVRKPRATKAQAASRANMKTFHQRTLPGRIATYGPMWLGGRLAPDAVRGRLDWLYGYDVTQDVSTG